MDKQFKEAFDQVQAEEKLKEHTKQSLYARLHKEQHAIHTSHLDVYKRQGHGIALTGHYMEDDWPRAGAQTTSPDIMANFEFMGWPAVDMLVNNKLLTKPNEHVGRCV